MNGVVDTLAGSGARGFADGVGAAAQLNWPRGLALDPVTGHLLVADSFNHRIRAVDPRSGAVSMLAGSGAEGAAEGDAAAASFNLPCGVAMDAQGGILVADTRNNRVRLVRQLSIAEIADKAAAEEAAAEKAAAEKAAADQLAADIARRAAADVARRVAAEKAAAEIAADIARRAAAPPDADLRTQLDLAVELRNPSLAAAIRARGGRFGSGLALACKAKDEALALAYVAAGANGNEPDRDGRTALHYCYGGGLGGMLGGFKGSLKEAGAAIKAAGGHV